MTDIEALAARLHFAAIHLLRRLRQAGDGAELSAAEMSAISTLVRTGPMTLTDLAAAEQVRPPTVTRLVQRLEAGGYVIRSASATDGRVSVVRHTTRAWATLEGAAAGRARALADTMANMPAEDIATLERAAVLLEQMAGHSPVPTR